MTVKGKLISSSIVLIMLFVLVCTVFVIGYRDIARKSEGMELLDHGLLSLQKMLRGLNEVIINEGTPSSLNLATGGLNDFDTIHTKLMLIINAPEAQIILSENIAPKWKYVKGGIKPFLENHYLDLDIDNDLLILYGKLITLTEEIMHDIELIEKNLHTELMSEERKIQFTVLIAILSALIVLGVHFRKLYKSIVRPIGELLLISAGFNKGNLSIMMDESRKDEFGLLARHFNKSVTKLQSERDLVKEKTVELEATHRKLVETARMVGKAEVASDVLHNVGNVLNSININTTMMSKMIRNSKTHYLSNIVNVLEEHTDDLETFITKDERGKQLPVFISELSKNLSEENNELLESISRLNSHIRHITEIISLQQSYGKISGLSEPVNLGELVEDALQINSEAIKRHNIEVRREYPELPSMLFDRSKVLQIITNLISNAKYALSKNVQDRKIMRLHIREPEENHIEIQVSDNGIGIEKDILSKIFGHGFTTRRDGHGFGLHSSALVAREIGGTLTATSEGSAKGATFTLSLPFKTEEIQNTDSYNL